MPPALPTSTTGREHHVDPQAAEVGAPIGRRRLERLGATPRRGRPRWAARRARPPSAARGRPRRRRPRAAAGRHRAASTRVRSSQIAVPPRTNTPARPRRALEQRQRVVGGVAVDADHERHRQPRPQRQVGGRGRARCGCRRSAIASSASSSPPPSGHAPGHEEDQAQHGRPPRSGGGGTPPGLAAAAPGRPPRRDEAAAWPPISLHGRRVCPRARPRVGSGPSTRSRSACSGGPKPRRPVPARARWRR